MKDINNLPQILGLYIGQKFTWDLGDTPRTLDHTVNFDALESSIKANTCFLLLRPLSSMTEDEARDLCDNFIKGFTFFDIYRNRYHGNIQISMDDNSCSVWIFESGLIDMNGDNKELGMGAIPHLCSLGFDCFNLIGQGIAKDINGL